MNDTSADNKRIAKNTLFMSIRMVVVLVITLYTSRVILDVLGVVDYGIYNVVSGFVTMFTFLNISLSNGIQRFYNFELGRSGVDGVKKVFNTAFLIQILLAIIIIIPTEFIGIWYLHNKMVFPIERMFAAEFVFQFTMLTFVMHIIQVPFTAAVMAHERMDFYALISVMNAVLTLVATFLISAIKEDGLILYSLFIFIISVISLICYCLFCRKHFSEIRIEGKHDKSLFKNMLSFSGWNIFGTMGQILKDQGVSLVLNLFFGPIVNAARGIANQVNGALQSFVSNITIPVRPQIVQSYSQNNIERSLSLTYTISKLSCFVLLLISLPIVFEIDFILKLWLGDNVPEHTSAFVVIIVVNAFILNLNSAVSGLVHATGKMRIYQLTGGAVSIMSIIVIYISLCYGCSAEVSLLYLVIMDIIRQILAVIILKYIVPEFSLKHYIVKVLYPVLAVMLISSIIPLTISLYIDENCIGFILICFISVVLSVMFIYLLGLNKHEKLIVTQLINKMKLKFITNKI